MIEEKKASYRPNEFSAVVSRDKFEECPPDTDPEKWSQFRDRYNSAAKLVHHPGPAQVDIELNSACNLRCSFCIQSVRDMGRHKLAWGAFTRAINEAVSLGAYSLKLNYQNEPLIRKDLEKHVRYAREAGMVNVFFSSNGILLKEDRAVELIEAGLTKLFVSIDATNSETYRRQRGNGYYNDVVRNIKRFIEIRNGLGKEFPLVRVNFLRNRGNMLEEELFLKMWTGVADMVIIQKMNELIDSTTDLFIREEEEEDFKCSFPFKQLVIRANGDVLPCCPMNGIDLRLGNVHHSTLEEIWNSEKAKSLRAVHERGGYKEIGPCRHCIDGKGCEK